MSKVSIMFVCLGNICRSPLAEAVLRSKLKAEGLDEQVEVTSSGTSNYHIGENADSRTLKIASKYGISMAHSASQFVSEDFFAYDYILVMDDSNLRDVMRIAPEGASAEIFKFRYFDPEDYNADMPDPWFGQDDGFEENYQITIRTSDSLLKHLKRTHHL